MNMSYSNVEKEKSARSWRVTLIKNRVELLGYVDAVDNTAAELAAIKAFNLSEEDRKRIIVRERLYYLAMSPGRERGPAA